MLRQYAPIIRRNVLTPFVLIIATLVTVLLLLHRRGDALFLASTITLNSLVGIFQEARAEAALRKLELLSQTAVRRHTRNGYELIPFKAIQVGDHLELSRGDQVPADGIVLSAHGLLVNEALLTGEPQEVGKHKGDTLLAGSLAVAGTALFEVTACGDGTRAGQMNAKLRRYEERLSPLQRNLAEILRWLTYVSVITAIIIVLNGRSENLSLQDIITRVVAGAITLVPEGLVLASTMLFTYGALRIARHGVLVQHLAALEGFGRLEILCVDKTGTLTESAMELDSFHPFFPYPEHRLREFLAAFLDSEDEPSPSLAALAPHLPENRMDLLERIEFSSTRKYSALLCQLPSKEQRALMLGAPEVVGRKARLTEAQERQVRDLSRQGLRVLLLADFGAPSDTLGATLEGTANPVGMVVLSNRLRANIADTVFYLQARGVSLRVISGDAPDTVRAIARKVGIRDTGKVITGEELAELDEADWERTVPNMTIFARVLPEQKERLIRTFKRHGFTGMVGDGVNDALALKRADLSVAMIEGSTAARQVADIVLSTNDFGIFPLATRLATQIILAVQMVACLFFNKITYGLVLLAWSLTFDTTYPLTPTHLVLLNALTVGLPTLLWSLVPPEAAYRLDLRKFFVRVVSFTVPNGIITGLAVISLSLLNRVQGFAYPETGDFLVIMVLGLLSFRLIPLFLQAVDSKRLRQVQAGYMVACLILIAVLSHSSVIVDVLQFTRLQPVQAADAAAVILIAAYCQFSLVRRRPHASIATV